MMRLTQRVRAFTPPLKIKLPVSLQPVLTGASTRPLWFDGRFLTARDLEREQHFFLRRQAELGRAGGFGVVHGLMVDQGASLSQPATAETIVIHAGNGMTPAGALVMIPSDLTIQLSDIADEENLDVQFGLSGTPQQPLRTRTGLYVLALRPVQFRANPITFYPASIQSPRVSRDGDVVEATAVSLVPYTNPVNQYDVSLQQAALAWQIFLEADTGTLSDALLPLAMISIDRDEIKWIDPYLVRRDSSPAADPTRLGLADPAVQQAFFLQYDAQLQMTVQTIQAGHMKANFAATNYFQALPPGGRFPLDAIDVVGFTQTFFPAQMNVQLAIIPWDELPAVMEDSLALPPIDLTLSADSYANMSVYALIPVARNTYTDLLGVAKPLTSSVPQALINRQPFRPFPLIPTQSTPTPTTTAPPGSATPPTEWENATSGQNYGFYLLRRSSPVFVDFTTPPQAAATVTSAVADAGAVPPAQTEETVAETASKVSNKGQKKSPRPRASKAGQVKQGK